MRTKRNLVTGALLLSLLTAQAVFGEVTVTNTTAVEILEAKWDAPNGS